MADLEGQIEIELAGKIDTTKDGGLRATFAKVPDAPVTKFVLNMEGGKKGLLVNSESLCKGTQKASVQMGGQNGIVSSTKMKLQIGVRRRCLESTESAAPSNREGVSHEAEERLTQ